MILYQIIPFLQSTKRKTKSLCTIELTWTKPLIQLKQKHKVRSLKNVLYFRFVYYSGVVFCIFYSSSYYQI